MLQTMQRLVVAALWGPLIGYGATGLLILSGYENQVVLTQMYGIDIPYIYALGFDGVVIVIFSLVVSICSHWKEFRSLQCERSLSPFGDGFS